MGFFCLMKAKLFFLESGKVENVFFILQNAFTIKKSERMEMC